MSIQGFLRRPALSALVAVVATALAGTAQADQSLRSYLYSVGGNNDFCTRAQQVLASTQMWSTNIVHSSLDAFTGSSAAPYFSPTNLSAYNAKGVDGYTLPLTTQQYTSSRELGTTGMYIPVVISCKMKTAEALAISFPGYSGAQRTCRDIHQNIVADVYSTLTAVERRMLRWQENQILYNADTYSVAGPTWLYPLPYLPRVAAITAGGALRFTGRAITVPSTDPSPDTLVGPDKKGSYYCHLASPDYVRALILGQMDPILETPPE